MPAFAALQDGFAQLSAPSKPSYAGTATSVAYGVDGCPDHGGCTEYTPGDYPSNIQVKNGTAIFVEGVYYLENGLTLASNSFVRPSTATAANASDQIGGTMFYFSGSSTVSVDANSGKPKGGATIDALNTTTGPVTTTCNYPPCNVLTNGIKCTTSSTVPSNIPATVGGNILLGACTGTYGDSLGTSDPAGEQHNKLFFQDRSAKSVNPNWGGGGQFLLAGTMYFHSCRASGAGTGCDSAPADNYYSDTLTLQGNSASGTYILGSIVVDNLALGGTSGINMDLNPNAAFNELKVSLLQ